MPKRKYTEASLAEAINRVRLGELSQRQASAEYGIPRATMFDKASGRRPPEMCAMGPSPYLTVDEEARIATWAIQMSKIGYERTKPQILQMAQQIIREDGRPNPFKEDKPGKNWFSRFMKRNPTLSLRTPQALGKERAVLTPKKIDRWFEGLHSYLVEQNAVSILTSPDRIWNADESGFALSPTSDRVIGMRGAKNNLSTLEAASASGVFCPPFIIYPGKRVSRKWRPMEGAPESWLHGFSESGSMNSELFLSWLADHFHPFLLSRGTHFPVLLLVDGDASHVDLHVAQYCQDKKIILYRIQAHASHVIQPLGLSVFGPLKKAFKESEGEWKDAHSGKFVTKASFAGVFAKAWADIKPELARTGFRAAGIFPFTRGYRREKLAPSQVLTIQAAPPATAAAATQTAAPTQPQVILALLTAVPAPPPATAIQAPPQAVPAPPPAAPPAAPPAQEAPTAADNPAMPRRSSSCPSPPNYVSPALDRSLKSPEATRTAPKRKTGELPETISVAHLISYQKKRREDKEAGEARKKKKKREEREAKKAEKEKRKGGKRSREEPRDEEVDEMVCSKCQDRFYLARDLQLQSVPMMMMQAVQQTGTGGPEVLSVAEVPIPKPGPHEILMRIHASAINRADTLQRRGLYPVPPGSTLVFGLEAAGEVCDVANSTPGKWKIGDRVMALLPGGGNAQYATAHEDHLIPVPDHLTFQQAAAIPEVWLTAFQLLFFVASLKKGDIVLIHAGGSGVGTAATQLVKEFGGIPIVTAGTEAKLQKAKSLGATEAFNYKEVDFAEKVLEVTQGKGVNIILDCVGGSYWEKNVKSFAPDGTWVLYGLMGGRNVEGALLGDILRKRISIRGTTLRPRSDQYKAELVKAFTEKALPHFTPSSPGEQPHFQPIIDRVFPLEEISAAHQYMDENKTLGKVTLSVAHSASKPSDEL